MTSEPPDIERLMRFANLDRASPHVSTAFFGIVIIGVLYTLFNAAASPQPPVILQKIYSLVQEVVYRSHRILDSGQTAIPRLARTETGSLGLQTTPSESASLPPAGLLNPFNGCYQHSVIQSLSSVVSLLSYLQSDDTADADTDQGMTDHLLHVLENLNNPQERGAKQYLPRQLNTIGPLSPFVQQDAQEYYSQLLDKVDREAQGETGGTKLSAISLRGSLDGRAVSKHGAAKSALTFVGGFAAPARNPLEGLQAQRVSCTACGYCEAITFNPFNCITLQPEGFERQHVSSLLDEWSRIDYIEGVTCENCTLLHFQRSIQSVLARPNFDGDRLELEARLEHIGNALLTQDFSDTILAEKCKIPPQTRMKRTKSKQIVIARSPRALVIHFNRSMYTERGEEKNDVAIEFDAMLDLRPWCVGPSLVEEHGKTPTITEAWSIDANTSMLPRGEILPSSNAEYQLRAVVQHSGIHNDGHYICYRKYAPQNEKVENWYLMNDEKVYNSGEDEALYDNGHAYMLFYERPDSKTSLAAIPLKAEDGSVVVAEEVDSDNDSSSPTESTLTTDETEVGSAADSRATSTVTTPLSLSQEFAAVKQ